MTSKVFNGRIVLEIIPRCDDRVIREVVVKISPGQWLWGVKGRIQRNGDQGGERSSQNQGNKGKWSAQVSLEIEMHSK